MIVDPRSKTLSRWVAASRPSGTPISSSMNSPASASWMVAGKRWRISGRTSTFWLNECPKSPWIARPTYAQSWTSSGWSSPS